jgi:hypothetical protein
MLNRKPDIDVEDIFSAVNEEEFWSLARSLIQGTVDTGFVGPLNSKNQANIVPRRKLDYTDDLPYVTHKPDHI